MNNSGIYVIAASDGRRYIGSAAAIEARWRRHLHDLRHGRHHSQKLQRAWNKYGENAFEFAIAELCPPDQLIAREQCWMDKQKPEFNIETRAGSSWGRKHTRETRLKLANIARRVQTGRKHSEESKLKRSLALKGRKPSPQAIRATIAACTGRPLTAAHKAKISAASRNMSDDTKAKIAASSRGRKQTPDAIRRRVLAYTTTCQLRRGRLQ